MASFKCPQCSAEVTKKKSEAAAGCPCCGYAQGLAKGEQPVLPVTAPYYVPYTQPWFPYQYPWYVTYPYVGDFPPFNPYPWGGTTLTVGKSMAETSDKILYGDLNTAGNTILFPQEVSSSFSIVTSTDVGSYSWT